MARLLALTALVLAASSAVGSGATGAAATRSSHGLASATAPAADETGYPNPAGAPPVDAAPAPRAWVELASLDAGEGRASSLVQIIAPAVAPLALAPKTSPPLALRS